MPGCFVDGCWASSCSTCLPLTCDHCMWRAAISHTPDCVVDGCWAKGTGPQQPHLPLKPSKHRGSGVEQPEARSGLAVAVLCMLYSPPCGFAVSHCTMHQSHCAVLCCAVPCCVCSVRGVPLRHAVLSTPGEAHPIVSVTFHLCTAMHGSEECNMPAGPQAAVLQQASCDTVCGLLGWG